MTRANTTKTNPIAESARARLRAARASEAAAVAAVHAAVIAGEKARAKLDAAVALRQKAVDEAAAILTHACADLVAASGVDRVALILDVSKVTLNAAVARTTGHAAETKATAASDSVTYRSAIGDANDLAS
jgi:hypothetical protein